MHKRFICIWLQHLFIFFGLNVAKWYIFVCWNELAFNWHQNFNIYAKFFPLSHSVIFKTNDNVFMSAYDFEWGTKFNETFCWYCCLVVGKSIQNCKNFTVKLWPKVWKMNFTSHWKCWPSKSWITHNGAHKHSYKSKIKWRKVFILFFVCYKILILLL